MSSVQTEGNNLHGTTTESRIPEGISEHERWAYQKEPYSPEWERRITKEMVGGGSLVEVLGGLGAIALAVLAVSNIIPQYLFPIAIMAVGVALAFESATLIMRHGHTPISFRTSPWVSVQFLTGIGGFVLGLLALIGLNPVSLVSISLIVLGSGLFLGSGLTAKLNSLETERKENVMAERHQRNWHFALVTVPVVTIQVLCGLGAIALGILALLGIATGVLSAVAIFALGGAVFLSGTAVGGRLMRV
jgi:hypothetical protein